MKKTIFTAIASLALMTSLGQGASATTHQANSSGKSFTSAWSVLKINTAEQTFKYGFNTTLINEDYTHTYHKTKAHRADVKNPSRSGSKNGSAGSYAKIEIRHGSSGTVYYTFSY